MPAGGSSQSGGQVWLPEVGDHVYVRFLDGEPEKPIWEWGTQDTKQAEKFPYQRLKDGGYSISGKAPTMGLLTRYGHALQFSPGAVILSSAGSYAHYISDSTEAKGQIGERTARGYLQEFDDSTDMLSLYVRNYTGLVSYLYFTGDDYKWVVSDQAAFAVGHIFMVDAGGLLQLAAPVAKIVSAHIELGELAIDPVVRLSDLQAVVNTIMDTFNEHMHTGNLGAATSTPLDPLKIEPTGSLVTMSV